MKLYIKVVLIIALALLMISATYLLTKRYADSCNIAKNDETKETLYENTKIGFSFKIPSDYVVSESYNYEGLFSGTFTLSKKISGNVASDMNLNIQISGDPLKSESIKNTTEKEGVIIEKNSVNIDGVEATRYEEGGMTSGTKVVWSNDKYSILISNYPNVGDVPLDDIITSFKFTK